MVGTTDLRLSQLLFQGLDPFANGQSINPEDLGQDVAQVARTKQNLRDGIDSEQELRELMQLLQTTDGSANGLPRPDFQNLGGMTSADMLQALIDWIQSGGPEANKKITRPAPIGNLATPQNYSSQPASFNGGGGGGMTSGGTGGATSTGSSAPAGSISTEVKPFNGQKVNPLAQEFMGGTVNFGEDRGDHAHAGEDWAAPEGTPIHSVADGTISSIQTTGESGGYGNLVTVKHEDGTETRYAHMSAFGEGLQVGDKVGAGTVLGAVGNTGNSTGPHLHFEVRQNGQPVPPNDWLQGAEEPRAA